jgi:hypothetical protein
MPMHQKSKYIRTDIILARGKIGSSEKMPQNARKCGLPVEAMGINPCLLSFLRKLLAAYCQTEATGTVVEAIRTGG